MSDPMAEIKASFFVECEELLESLQDGLQAIYDGANDDETVNIVFRAVHSIKGGAGAFGLDDLVGFAHKLETALDLVRAHELAVTPEILKLFFVCSDVLADLVRDSREGIPHDPETIAPTVAELEKIVGNPDESEAEETVDFEVTTLSLDLIDDEDAAASAEPVWDIAFAPKPMLYVNGNEPQFLFRALRDLGDLTVTCDDSDVPELHDLDPEHGHLRWDLRFISNENEASIREAFEFVEDLCQLEIRQTAAGENQDLPTLPDLADLASLEDGPADQSTEPPAAFSDPSQPAAEDAPLLTTKSPGASETPPDESVTASKPEPAKEPNRRAPSAAIPKATVRVDLDRIDRLVNLVGEIVINQAMLSQSVEAAGIPPNSPVRTGLEEFQQLTRDIQESVMMIRAQPVKSLFQRMSRIVREASSAIGKDVRLRTDGENTEVDKTVIERLADPLTHMIRNAVDHGLEQNDAREAAGKPREGCVRLTAVHRSGRVVIEVRDDGAGINRDKVLAKAMEKGLIPPDSQLSDGEIDNLLFLPGFSTADEISNLSGRGVGMDVVRNAIQSLGGRISIQSEPGQGTKFSISLPLTLAVLDGMVIRVAGETLVIPLNTIFETLAVSKEDLRSLGPSTHVISIRDTFVPLIDLGAELGYREPLDDYAGGVVLLIGQEDGLAAAVVVDTIEDQRQVVIKGLQESYGRVPGIAAATILGDGQIALILDPVDLISQSSGRTRPSKTARGAEATSLMETNGATQ